MEPADDQLRVVLADDHHFFREGLRDVLTQEGITVVGEASDGLGAVSLARDLSPDVLVMDLNMPGVAGMDRIEQIGDSRPGVRVVVLTVSVADADIFEALASGACAYLLKDTQGKLIAGAIRQAAGGHSVLSDVVMQTLVAGMPPNKRTTEPAKDGPELTTRELDVLRLIADGADNAAIGHALSISKHTVKQHVTNILEKLGLQQSRPSGRLCSTRRAGLTARLDATAWLSRLRQAVRSTALPPAGRRRPAWRRPSRRGDES